MPSSERITMHLERIEVLYRPNGSVWVRHLEGATAGEWFGPFESIADAVEAGVA